MRRYINGYREKENAMAYIHLRHVHGGSREMGLWRAAGESYPVVHEVMKKETIDFTPGARREDQAHSVPSIPAEGYTSLKKYIQHLHIQQSR